MSDPLKGQVLANRYELLEKVGEGGMAQVYRARDALLGRTVAVKVLRQQFSSDREFVERFRLEAQAAASLTHPNVVNIYDVGEEDGIHFIVMEFVEGENLKELIRREAPLAPKRAVEIGIEIAKALDAAHQRNLVHRDIKPHNILVTDGGVKVTDFGIARAASASSLTQTGTVIGSVHYFSPQQARGDTVDSASDIYSLGVVLYEMVTGGLPFTGESPVAVALKHIQESAVLVSKLNESVPISLERVIAKAMAKSKEERYRSAAELVTALSRVADDLPSANDAGDQDPGGKTQVLTSVEPDQERTLIRRAKGDEPSMPKSEAPPPKKRSRLVVVFVLLSFVAGLVWAAQKLPQLIFPEVVRVPSLTELDVKTARERLAQAGLRLDENIQDVYSRDVAAGLIVRQDPEANHRVRMGREIRVTVSRGPEYVVVPDVVGITKIEAQLRITQQNLTLGEVGEKFNPDVPPNTVVAQDPPGGTRLEESKAVDITVARGSQPQATVTMPDVRGMTLDDARRKLDALGLVEGQLHAEPHPSAAPGVVIDQNPQPGEDVEVGYPYGLAYASRPDESEEVVPAPSEETAVQEKYWERRILVSVPEGPSQEVVIMVTDDWGPRQVFREVRKGGSRFYQKVRIRGDKARIQVWMDGIPQMDEEVKRR